MRTHCSGFSATCQTTNDGPHQQSILPGVRRHPAPYRTLPHIYQAPVSLLSISSSQSSPSKSGVICAGLYGSRGRSCIAQSYLCENSSKVSSPWSALLCTAEEVNGDLAQMVDVLGAIRAALGAARKTDRNNDEDGRAAARRALRAIATGCGGGRVRGSGSERYTGIQSSV